jgi:hypothetical protein
MHYHLGIKLPDCIQHDPNDDQECSATEQLVAAHAREEWQDGYQPTVQCLLATG